MEGGQSSGAPGTLGATNVASPAPAFSSSTGALDGHRVPLVSRESSAAGTCRAQGAAVASKVSLSLPPSLTLSMGSGVQTVSSWGSHVQNQHQEPSLGHCREVANGK